MIYLAFGLVAGLLIVGVPLMKRRARQRAAVSKLSIQTPRGVVEERSVRIGGIDQWVGIRGEDQENPVMLVLHGGPGCSYTIFTPHMRGWEKHFTIVQWDQRGSGRSFGRNGKRESGDLSFEQLSRDAEEVAEYARKRMGKERVFLLASSLGSTFGMRLARRRPDLLYAYIGTDQNVGMQRRREESHREVVERLCALGLVKGVQAMERIGADPASWTVADYEAVARWTMRSDRAGYERTMELLKNAVWHAPDWSLRDVRMFVKGMRYSLERLLPDIVTFDAWDEGVRFEIPFCLFQGANDVLTTPVLARAFFEDVIAPEKQFGLIADAGHFAAFQQPEEFLRQLLIGVRPLANDARPAAMA
jgi:pimeloyl-ACP methyl ester carboxylesterase